MIIYLFSEHVFISSFIFKLVFVTNILTHPPCIDGYCHSLRMINEKATTIITIGNRTGASYIVICFHLTVDARGADMFWDEIHNASSLFALKIHLKYTKKKQ